MGRRERSERLGLFSGVVLLSGVVPPVVVVAIADFSHDLLSDIVDERRSALRRQAKGEESLTPSTATGESAVCLSVFLCARSCYSM